MRAKIVFNPLCKIRSGAFKFFIAKCTGFCNPVSWTRASCWTKMITFHRTILSIITNKTFKRYIANNTGLCLLTSKVCSSFVCHKVNIHNNIEIDKDYFDASEKRFKLVTSQKQIEF